MHLGRVHWPPQHRLKDTLKLRPQRTLRPKERISLHHPPCSPAWLSLLKQQAAEGRAERRTPIARRDAGMSVRPVSGLTSEQRTIAARPYHLPTSATQWFEGLVSRYGLTRIPLRGQRRNVALQRGTGFPFIASSSDTITWRWREDREGEQRGQELVIERLPGPKACEGTLVNAQAVRPLAAGSQSGCAKNPWF